MGAQFIVDAFWGDAGKGKFSAFLSMKEDAAGCVRAGIGPNAGHSIYVGGNLIKARLLPLGFMCPTTKLYIGPGVAVDPSVFLSEVTQTATQGRAFIDYRCPVILEEHKEREKNDPQLKEIDSTMSGAGAARADYIMRRGKRVESVESLKPYLTDAVEECNRIATTGTLIVEGAQATFLSLYLSNRYPYTTSDNCTTAALADDIGLNWKLIEKVLLLVKCLPTAVGNGPLPNEMTKDEILQSGLAEYGVNTGRFRRRVRSIDSSLLKYSVMLNGPTEIALTYCDQYDLEMRDCMDESRITKKMRELISQVELWAGTRVSYLETGKDFRSILPLSNVRAQK
jgi:adenylosuccinate synthase